MIMSASREDIKDWLEQGRERGATHVLIVTDTWDYSNYPVYVLPDKSVVGVIAGYVDSQDRVEEVYSLSMSDEEQLNSRRVWNV
jgi:hypothetical protein